MSSAEPVPCTISVSDPVSGLDSLSLTVTTPGQNCSFTLTSPDAGGDGTACRRPGVEEAEGGSEEGGDTFICTLDQLEAGTSYELQIESQSDEETANITLQTSKS